MDGSRLSTSRLSGEKPIVHFREIIQIPEIMIFHPPLVRVTGNIHIFAFLCLLDMLRAPKYYNWLTNVGDTSTGKPFVPATIFVQTQ